MPFSFAFCRQRTKSKWAKRIKSQWTNDKTIVSDIYQVDLCENAIAKVNPEMIGLVVNNFFSNAVKHSDVGGDVEIKLERVHDNKLLKFYLFLLYHSQNYFRLVRLERVNLRSNI